MYIPPVPVELAEIFAALILIFAPFAPISSTAVKVNKSTSPMAMPAPLVFVIDPPAIKVTSLANCELSGSALASIAPTKIISPPALA